MSATFVGMPAFPEAARVALANTQLRHNLTHATHTIRDKRARVVAEVPDWEELRHVVTGHGPRSQYRLDLRRRARENSAWVRKVVLAEAA